MHNDNFFGKRIKYSQREVDFILYNLKLDDYDLTTPNNLSYLNETFDKYYTIDPSKKIYLNPRYCLVSDESIRWIKDDLRAALWFYSFLVIRQRWEFEIIIEHAVFSKDLILSFDSYHKRVGTRGFICRDFNLLNKNRLVRIAMPLYSEYKTSHKYLIWLDRKDQEQMDWAIDYLQERELLINAPTFLSINTKECYAQICASLDALDLHPNLKEKLNDYQTAKAKNTSKDNQTSDQDVSSQEQQLISSNNNMVQAIRKTIDVNSDRNTYINEPKTKAYITLIREKYKVSDAKKDVLMKMRTAWNQKVFRDKKTVKPEKRIKLPHGYEKKVKEISIAYDEEMVACLKRIIDEEYNQIKSEK